METEKDMEAAVTLVTRSSAEIMTGAAMILHTIEYRLTGLIHAHISLIIIKVTDYCSFAKIKKQMQNQSSEKRERERERMQAGSRSEIIHFDYFKHPQSKDLKRWHTYCEHTLSLYCTVGLAFSKPTNEKAFVKDGMKTWSRVHQRIKEHERSIVHTDCTDAYFQT